MITELPKESVNKLVLSINNKYDVNISEDIISFFQDFQSKLAIDYGFANKEEVRLYNLASFKYSDAKVDSKMIFNRLLVKYNGDRDAAMAEFKELGKEININKRNARIANKTNKLDTQINKPVLLVSLDKKFVVH